MKKLLPEPIDFIVHYPLMHYIRSMLTMPPKNTVAYAVSPKATSVLVTPRKGGAAVFSDNVANVEGAPNSDMLDPATSDEHAFASEGVYYKSVTRKYGLARGGDAVLIIDHPRLYLNFHGMQAANVTIAKVYEELARAPQSILPGWQGGEAYQWAAVTDRLEVASEGAFASTLQQLFLTGLPSTLVDFICAWGVYNKQTLRAIIPFPLAVAGWARESYGQNGMFHLVVPSVNSICVFTFCEGRCTHYFAPKNDNYAASEVAGAIEDVNSTVSDSPRDTPVYVWPTTGSDVEKLVQGIKQSGVRNATVVSLQSEGGLPLSPSVSLLEWALQSSLEGFTKLAGGVSSFDLPLGDDKS
jgi:hypothetical protein